jgi:hypothetical protein
MGFGAARSLDYVPDKEMLRAKFRRWHVEALLNQAADLADKCVGELREHSSLDYSWNRFSQELAVQEKELKLDQERIGFFQRDHDSATKRQTYFTESKEQYDASIFHADKLYNQHGGGENGGALHTQAGQNLNEKNVETFNRNLAKALSNLEVGWTESDATYNQARLDARKDNLDKIRELSTGKNSLALDWQSDLLWARIQRSYEDALNRATVAHAGLTEIYGYDKPLPALSAPEKSVHEKVSDLTIWIRNAVEWLVAYQQCDQSFTRILSIRSVLTDDEWHSLKHSNDQFSASIQVPEKLFSGHHNVRLRGIGASLVGDAGEIPWSMIVRPPENAVYRRLPTDKKVIQSDLPPCVLGRVENRKSNRQLELCGLISLMNASPIADVGAGAWHIELARPESTDEEFSEISDVILEFSSIGQPILPA